MGLGRQFRDAVLRIPGIRVVEAGGRNYGSGAIQQRQGRRGIVATVAALLLWGFGLEYVLHSYVFLSPPESSFQKIK
jgi:hypothetical protein